LLILVPEQFQEAIKQWFIKNWGNVASVWGLSVSIYVLRVAKGARRAAEDAKMASRTRNALQELQSAVVSSAEIGQYASTGHWLVVKLRASEVLGCCRNTVNRWGEDSALKGSRNRLNHAAEQMRSIAEEATQPEPNLQAVIRAQLDAHEALNAVVGKILKEQEARS
jgi:hypothetical protein